MNEELFKDHMVIIDDIFTKHEKINITEMTYRKYIVNRNSMCWIFGKLWQVTYCRRSK